ncbi:MraY family glycosyltransferase [Aeribacillus composti]|uniref:MraY family glycosyltransferase n=1 Tax=Aeribacillus composti TaxID=1868734 RepID=UPI002E1F52D9|nr:MraY family glycosyltransferase [Aeribacillus composti]
MNYSQYIIAFILTFVMASLLTPFVKKLALKINAVDYPEGRKVHTKVMPRLGGLAIFFAVVIGFLYLQPDDPHMLKIILGATIVLITGILDDIFTLTPKQKLCGQLLAAFVVVTSGLLIDKVTLPFVGTVYIEEYLSYPLTILWIVGVTNAINLIDGLDGLAAGVTAIALTSIMIMGFMDGRLVVVALSVILIGSTLGFLVHNFYPAKIFMGDTGAMFLGYSVAIISMLGLFKNVALFSFVIPIIVLAIPLFDTIFAIIRRILNKQSITMADKHHLHYCLVDLGFSHRTSVLIIYLISACFGVSAILFTHATLWASLIIMIVLIIIIQIGAEIVGLIGENQKPFLNMLKKIFSLNKPQKDNS